MKKTRVAIIHQSIAPHRISLFNEISKKKDIDLTVFFLIEKASDRKWDPDLYKNNIKFNYKILPRFKITFPFSNPIDININFSIFNELRQGKFDVVISAGWIDFACQIAPFFKKIFKYKFILWAGSTKNESSLQRQITLPLVKAIIKRTDFLMSYGTKSKDYLISLGAPATKILPVFNPVNVGLFKNKSKLLTLDKKNKLKKKFNIDQQQKIILYVGQFIERKNVETLIRAVAKINKKSITLVLQGYGKLKPAYKNLAKSLKINLKVLPHTETDSIPLIYAMSDLFVLPSREEVWGLVVNEAMACSLPVIVSNKAGCVSDLIKESENGFTFKHDSFNDLSKKILKILGDNKTTKDMGKKSLEIISKMDCGSGANVVYKAIKDSLLL